jgi:aminoglycoside phosphotransferase (APT) family kinase protein
MEFGFSSMVQDAGDGCVRRVARTPEARRRLAQECRFLPRLAARLPVAIPVPLRCDEMSMTYRRLPGTTLSPGSAYPQLAREIASFIGALHAIPVADALDFGIPPRNRTAELLAAADRTLPFLPPAARLWREAFVELPHPKAVIHGDLWYENILIDPVAGSLTGVLDFEHAGIGDPAWDLATQLHCGSDFARLVCHAYAPGDDDLWRRAQQLFPLRAFEGVDWALQQGDSAEFDESVRKLQSVGVLP